jgi:hypothetical protein
MLHPVPQRLWFTSNNKPAWRRALCLDSPGSATALEAFGSPARGTPGRTSSVLTCSYSPLRRISTLPEIQDGSGLAGMEKLRRLSQPTGHRPHVSVGHLGEKPATRRADSRGPYPTESPDPAGDSGPTA